MDCIPPRVKLSDDTFIFLDGKWVNETCIQSAFPSSAEAQKKHVNKKMHNDWTLWEENKALWEENKALRVENRALREENKALQYLRMENKGIQVIYDESLQQILQQENKPLVALPLIEGLQNSKENKAIQLIQGEKKALQLFLEKNLPLKVFSQERKLTPVLKKEDSLDQETKKNIVQEANNKPASADAVRIVQEIQEENSAMTGKERQQTSLSLLDENEILEAVQKLNQTVLFLLRENHVLMEEKQALQTVQGGNKILWEENNTLKLQQKAIKGALSKIIAQMGLLQEELNSFAFMQESENTE
ncbi:protein chibby homolog 2 [Sceloporus undulatus]|uniref:protein chibby homolog 2 n=1 Tax=Sceloporus undulatus TaxID=8520 RepID=UPI001C4D36DD|nr:protein chibby homolog 2 [Sceloporus undulatus]XP_042316695.1 protein chibby homolog 2 [Sceloporus undulatus]XP_042316698.1 protein chibby homolog 2 [Sceloporus undulatus]